MDRACRSHCSRVMVANAVKICVYHTKEQVVAGHLHNGVPDPVTHWVATQCFTGGNQNTACIAIARNLPVAVAQTYLWPFDAMITRVRETENIRWSNLFYSHNSHEIQIGCMRIPSPKVPIVPYTKSYCFYKFNCVYLVIYAGRAKRTLDTLALEHIQVWVEK